MNRRFTPDSLGPVQLVGGWTEFLAELRSLPLEESIPILVIGSIALAYLVDQIVRRGLGRLVAGSKTDLDDAVLDTLHWPIVVTVLLVGTVVTISVLPPDLRSVVNPFVGLPALTGLILVWAWAVNRIGGQLFTEASEHDGAAASVAPVLSNLLTFGVIAGTLFAVLSLWGVDITPLLASAGLVGIAVGFAAKDTVANFFGGIALYVDQTYQVGDYVTLDTGESGTVAKVGIRSTTLLTRDEVLVTVPNAVLNASMITNESAPTRRKRIRVPVNVAYGSDLETVQRALAETTAAEDRILDKPSPRIRLLALGDNGIEYQVRCWVGNPTRETKARHALLRRIYDRFQELDIDIPFPQRQIHVADGSTIPTVATAAPIADGNRSSAPQDEP